MTYTVKILNKTHKVASIREARDLWVTIRDRVNFGASRQCGVNICQDGEPVARVSYNGRVWTPGDFETAKELTI